MSRKMFFGLSSVIRAKTPLLSHIYARSIFRLQQRVVIEARNIGGSFINASLIADIGKIFSLVPMLAAGNSPNTARC